MIFVGERAETVAEKTTSLAWRARVLGGDGSPPTRRTCLML